MTLTTLKTLEHRLMRQLRPPDMTAQTASPPDMMAQMAGSLRQLIKAETDALAQEHARELETVKQHHQGELEKLRREADARVAQMHEELRAARSELRELREDARKETHTMQGMHAEALQRVQTQLADERGKRAEAEARLEAARATHATTERLLKESKATPAAAPQVTVTAPRMEKAKPISYTFDVQRRADGLIASVVLKPLT